MLAERVEYHLCIASVSRDECEATCKNETGNYKSKNFNTVNNILKFGMS